MCISGGSENHISVKRSGVSAAKYHGNKHNVAMASRMSYAGALSISGSAWRWRNLWHPAAASRMYLCW